MWFRLSGDQRFLAEAADAIEVLAGVDRVKWSYLNTHAACWTVGDLAMALDCVWNELDDDRRRLAVEALTHRTAEMHPHTIRESLRNPLDSHPRVYGLNNTLPAILTLFGHAPQAEQWLWDLVQFIEEHCPSMGGDDGGWAVGFGYGGPWLMMRALHMVRTATGLDYFDMPWMRNQAKLLLYFWPAKWACTSFGDVGYSDRPMFREADMLARLYNDPHSAWYAEQRVLHRDDREVGVHLGMMLAAPERPQPTPPTDLPGGRHLRDVGWVAMHSDLANPDNDVFLQFKSSRYGSYNHCHADQNSLILAAFGQRLFIDSGYYPWYGSNHDKHWTRQTRAHNALLFGNRGQGVWNLSASGRIVTFATTPAADFVVGDATTAYRQPSLYDAPADLCAAVEVTNPVFSAVRHVLFIRPGTIIILDDCRLRDPMSVQFLLHAEQPLDLNESKRTALLRVNGAAARVSFLGADPLALRQTNQFSHPPEVLNKDNPFQDQWHLTADFAATGTLRRLVTVIQVGRANELDAVTGVSVEHDGGAILVNLGAARATFDLHPETARVHWQSGDAWFEHSFAYRSVDEAAQTMR